MSERDQRLKGYGVFACRACGQPIPPAWAAKGLRLFESVEAGYCSHVHLEQGRRNGWPDDPAEQFQHRLTPSEKVGVGTEVGER